jgi:hypothetical protein
LLLRVAGTAPFAALLRDLRALAQATGSDKLRIGIIGSGHIGSTIGRLWVKSGHGAPGYGQPVTAPELRQKRSFTR